VTIFCSAIWSLTFVVSAILTTKRSRRLSRSGWRDRQKISILVELTVCQKKVANALNSVVIILKNKVLFVTFPFFFMVELQNFLNAPRICILFFIAYEYCLFILWLQHVSWLRLSASNSLTCRCENVARFQSLRLSAAVWRYLASPGTSISSECFLS